MPPGSGKIVIHHDELPTAHILQYGTFNTRLWCRDLLCLFLVHASEDQEPLQYLRFQFRVTGTPTPHPVNTLPCIIFNHVFDQALMSQIQAGNSRVVGTFQPDSVTVPEAGHR